MNTNYTIKVSPVYKQVTVEFNNCLFTIDGNNQVTVTPIEGNSKHKITRNKKGSRGLVFLERKNSYVRVLATTASKIISDTNRMISRTYKDYGNLHLLIVNDNDNGIIRKETFNLKPVEQYNHEYNVEEFNRFKRTIEEKPFFPLARSMSANLTFHQLNLFTSLLKDEDKGHCEK